MTTHLREYMVYFSTMLNNETVSPRLQFPSINEIWCWCICLGLAGYAGGIFEPSAQRISAGGVFGDIAGAGGFNLAAWAMVLWRLRRIGPASPASLWLVVAAFAYGVSCAVPLAPCLALGLAGLGLVLLRRRDSSEPGREAGWLILLLGVCWGAPYARPVHLIVARFDAVAAGLLVRLAGGQAQVSGNIVGTPEFSIEVFTACASSTPLPEVMLAYLVVVFYRGGHFGRAHFGYLAGSFGVSMALSEIRLGLMEPSRADWRFWHFELGATMYELAALVSALAWPYLATWRLGRVKALPALRA